MVRIVALGVLGAAGLHLVIGERDGSGDLRSVPGDETTVSLDD
jgi:hypothetical protein